MAEATLRQSIISPAAKKFTFTLTYDKQSNVCLVRYGNSATEPTIPSLRCKTLEELNGRQTQYEQGRLFQRNDYKPVDFIVDKDGLILTEHRRTSGNNEISCNLSCSLGCSLFGKFFWGKFLDQTYRLFTSILIQ